MGAGTEASSQDQETRQKTKETTGYSNNAYRSQSLPYPVDRIHEVAANRVREDSVKIDLKKIFAGFKNVDVVLDNITNIDFKKRQLIGESKTYRYDYLVIGTGSKPTFFGTPGAEEHAFTLWSFEDAVRLREHIPEMFRRAIKERNPEVRKQLLTFVVVGAGFTGVEMIGELAEWVEDLCEEYGVERSEVELYVADMR